MLRNGTCRFCGQSRMVDAEDEEKANGIASVECDCDQAKNWKKIMTMRNTVDQMFGFGADERGFSSLAQSQTGAIKTMAELVMGGAFDSCTLTYDTVKAQLKATKDGSVRIIRKDQNGIQADC